MVKYICSECLSPYTKAENFVKHVEKTGHNKDTRSYEAAKKEAAESK